MSDDAKATLGLLGTIFAFVAMLALVSSGFEIYKQAKIDGCLAASEATYSQRWDEECIDEGKGADCSLSLAVADSFRAELNAANTVCVERY